ncbi:MAG: flagellar brake protein [Steroidobacteraceae bacterium]
MVSFAEANLKPGQPIQLQLQCTDRARLYTSLIGYLNDHAILVTTPGLSLANDAYAMLEGDQFVCRTFSGRRAFAFQTSVLRVATAPFPHLYLSYPQQVEAVVIRKATRVPCRGEVSISKPGCEGTNAFVATLCDLSLTGAGVQGGPDLAKQSDGVELTLPGASGQELKIKATVRAVRAAEDGKDPRRCHFGLEFVDLSPDQTSGLLEIVQQRLLEEV